MCLVPIKEELMMGEEKESSWQAGLGLKSAVEGGPKRSQVVSFILGEKVREADNLCR